MANTVSTEVSAPAAAAAAGAPPSARYRERAARLAESLERIALPDSAQLVPALRAVAAGADAPRLRVRVSWDAALARADVAGLLSTLSPTQAPPAWLALIEPLPQPAFDAEVSAAGWTVVPAGPAPLLTLQLKGGAPANGKTLPAEAVLARTGIAAPLRIAVAHEAMPRQGRRARYFGDALSLAALDISLRDVCARAASSLRAGLAAAPPATAGPGPAAAPRPASTGAGAASGGLAVARIHADIGSELRRNSKLLLLRDGAGRALIDKLIAKVREEHFDREDGGKSWRLKLNPVFRSKLESALQRGLEQLLENDLASIHARMLEVDGAARVDLEPLVARCREECAYFMQQVAQVDPTFHAELPKRTLMSRLGEARRMVFAALMSIGLVGTFFGANVRRLSWIGLGLLAIFVFTTLRTYKQWQQEDALQLAKEKERLRDVLEGDMARIIGDAEREKQSRLQVLLDEWRRAHAEAPALAAPAAPPAPGPAPAAVPAPPAAAAAARSAAPAISLELALQSATQLAERLSADIEQALRRSFPTPVTPAP